MTTTILTMDDKRRIMDSNMLPWHPQVVAAINDAEQAVLQSPEIQALRKDAKRYRAIRDVFYAQGSRAFYEIEIGATPSHDTEEAIRILFDDAISAAVEQQI